ncbi:MAG: dienelactone hydrolase [Actinomycetota bacterium]|nr:dienelactone hydrolase [Actinomycetota bacterium]
MTLDVALVLAPGAGGAPDHPTLVAIAEAMAPVPVDRVRLPGNAPAAVKAVMTAADALCRRTGVAPDRLVLGGRSFGGRMCSMAVADGLPALGLALVSYPLHPPGRPTQLRTEHFPELTVRCLFVSGRGDPFARVDELESATAAIPAPVTHVWVTGGHALRGQDAVVASVVKKWVAELVGPGPRG